MVSKIRKPSHMKLKCLKKLVYYMISMCHYHNLYFNKIIAAYFLEKIVLLKSENILMHVTFVKPKSTQSMALLYGDRTGQQPRKPKQMDFLHQLHKLL